MEIFWAAISLKSPSQTELSMELTFAIENLALVDMCQLFVLEEIQHQLRQGKNK